jgi:hypothetical protein
MYQVPSTKYQGQVPSANFQVPSLKEAQIRDPMFRALIETCVLKFFWRLAVWRLGFSTPRTLVA